MNVETTTIPDVIPSNIDSSKIVLADSIIRNIYPLFDEVYKGKLKELEDLNEELKRKKEQVRQEKQKLENLVAEYKRKKKITKLLDRIEKLVNSGLVYDGSLAHETRILLKIIMKLPEDKLDYHQRETLRLISKRFSK